MNPTMAVKKSLPTASNEEEAKEHEKEASKPQSKKTVESEDFDESEEEVEFGFEKLKSALDFTKPTSVITDEAEKLETLVTKPLLEKRRAENDKSAAKSKKAKTEVAGQKDEKVAGGANSEKKYAINRLWSEEDEICILKGVLEFQSKFGKDLSTLQQDFHGFVKDSIHVVSKTQLIDKIRKLKREHMTNLKRTNNRKDPSFFKSREVKFFKLCKKIWGGGDKNGDIDGTEKFEAIGFIKSSMEENQKGLVKGKPEKANENDIDDLGKLYPWLMNGCNRDHMTNMLIPGFLKMNMNLIGGSELKYLDSKWKKQSVDEMVVYVGRLDILEEEAKMVLNAMRSNQN